MRQEHRQHTSDEAAACYDFFLSSCQVMASFFFKMISTRLSFFLKEADSIGSLKGEMVRPNSLPSLAILKSIDTSVDTYIDHTIFSRKHIITPRQSSTHMKFKSAIVISGNRA